MCLALQRLDLLVVGTEWGDTRRVLLLSQKIRGGGGVGWGEKLCEVGWVGDSDWDVR